MSFFNGISFLRSGQQRCHQLELIYFMFLCVSYGLVAYSCRNKLSLLGFRRQCEVQNSIFIFHVSVGGCFCFHEIVHGNFWKTKLVDLLLIRFVDLLGWQFKKTNTHNKCLLCQWQLISTYELWWMNDWDGNVLGRGRQLRSLLFIFRVAVLFVRVFIYLYLNFVFA